MAEVGKDLRNVLAEAFHFIEGKTEGQRVMSRVISLVMQEPGIERESYDCKFRAPSTPFPTIRCKNSCLLMTEATHRLYSIMNTLIEKMGREHLNRKMTDYKRKMKMTDKHFLKCSGSLESKDCKLQEDTTSNYQDNKM